MNFIFLSVFLLTLIIFSLNYDVYGEEKVIIVLPGSGDPACVDDDSCLSPSTIYLEIGDTIRLEREIKFLTSFTGGKPEQAGTLPKQGYVGPYGESGVFYFFDITHPWIVGKIVVGLTDPPEHTYEESKAKSDQIKEEIQQEQDAQSLEGAKNYIEELKNKFQILYDVISDLEFQIEKLTIQNNNLREKLEEKLDDNVSIKSERKSIASFVDNEKNPQSYIDRYNNEPEYKKWFDDNYPQYDSIEEAVGLELTEQIPGWVKNIFGWYAADQVSEVELLNAIKYLINEKILIVN